MDGLCVDINFLTTGEGKASIAESADFDVPFTRLNLDQGALVVRLFSDAGGYQKVVSGSDLCQRDPRTGEETGKDEKASVVDEVHRGNGGCGGGRGESSMVQRHFAHVG